MTAPIIGFCGMTHLGLVSSVAAADKGFKVICFDQDIEIINNLKIYNFSISEPQLEDLAKKNSHHIFFTSNVNDLAKCDLLYIALDVPTDSRGKSNLDPLSQLLGLIFDIASKNTTIVILSQVPPGYSRKNIRLGRSCYYQVETLIFGCAVERAQKPERFIVGCSDPEEALPQAYDVFLKAFSCPIIKMGYESAEMAKIAINMYLVSSIATTNTIAELCEKIGADWAEIIPALRMDKRIGQFAYLIPGLGISGGNLERDLETASSLADFFKTDVGVVRSWVANSKKRKRWPMQVLSAEVFEKNPNAKIALWGLAYKENTNSTKNAPSLSILEYINEGMAQVFDPVISSVSINKKQFHSTSSALSACANADALVIITPWPQFSEINPKDIAQKLKGNIILDPYKVLNANRCLDAGLRYFTLGARSN
jgi:UDPglucose 6-dehydrogenase